MVRRPSFLVSHIFKHKYLFNQWADHNEILTEASLGWGKGCIRFGARSDKKSGFHGNGYCAFGNFRVTFISRFFHFRIIREFLNSRARIRVVGHFCGLKIGALCISCERQINVMHRITAHAVRQLKLEILFVLFSPQRDNHIVCNRY